MGTAVYPYFVIPHTPENIGWLMIPLVFIWDSLCHQCHYRPRASQQLFEGQPLAWQYRTTWFCGAYCYWLYGMHNSIGAGLLLMAVFVCGLIPTLFIKEKH